MPVQPVAYDPQNIFAKMLRGEIPCLKVYEDDAALAFMDIMPRADGHVLVIPKAPARNLLDVDPAVLAAMAPALTKLAKAVVKATGADGLTMQQFSEPAGGQVVFHLHIHLLPRREGVALRPHTGQIAKTEELEMWAKIRAAL
ncbi:MAG: HIT family protein [Rhodoblastus sp.]|nr:MAG: HIT family protein [Rhodoblastus sp.]